MISGRTALAVVTLLGGLADSLPAAEWRIPDNAPLLTPWAKNVSPTNALPEYPRPQMVRQRWQNLNGLWDYAVASKSEDKPPASYQGKILVPYPIESALSGVMEPFLPKDRLWYRRTFNVPEAWRGQRILLHFGAVDWQATIYVNGRELGGHIAVFQGPDGQEWFSYRWESGGQSQGRLCIAPLQLTEKGWPRPSKPSIEKVMIR